MPAWAAPSAFRDAAPRVAAPPREWHVSAAAIVVCTGLWFYLNGYRFGVGEHALELPRLLRALDPRFLRGDPLVDTLAAHPSLLSLLAPLVRVVSLEWACLALQLLSVAGIFASIAALARAVFPGAWGRWAGVVAPALLVTLKTTIADVPVITDLVSGRTVALAPILYALALAARGRPRAALVVAGLAANLDAASALPAFGTVLLVGLLGGHGARRLLAGLAAGAAAAAPALGYALTELGRGIPTPAPDSWVAIQARFPYFHHQASSFSVNEWLQLVPPLLVIATVVVGSRGREAWRPARRLAGALLAAIGASCLVASIGADALRIPALFQLRLWESTRLLDPLAAAVGAGWLVAVLGSRGAVLARAAALLLVVAYGLGRPASLDMPVVLAMLVLALGCLRVDASAPREATPPRRWAPLAFAVVTVVAVNARSLAGEQKLYKRPGVQVHFAELWGARAMSWCREHLPEDAVVLIPPSHHGDMPAFRYGARRRSLVSIPDVNATALSVGYASEWRARIEDQGGIALTFLDAGATAAPPDGRLEREISESYWAASVEDLRGLRARYGVSYAVLPKTFEGRWSKRLELPLLYQDRWYRVYALAE